MTAIFQALDEALTSALAEVLGDPTGEARARVIFAFLQTTMVQDRAEEVAGQAFLAKWNNVAASFDNHIGAQAAFQVAIELLAEGFAVDTLSRGLEMLQRSVRWSIPEACELMGTYFERGLVADDGTVLVEGGRFKSAMDFYTRPANVEPGLPSFLRQTSGSQYRASMILKNGNGGVRIDGKASLDWCHCSAANLNAGAVWSLGARKVPSCRPMDPPNPVPEDLWQALSYLKFGHDYHNSDEDEDGEEPAEWAIMTNNVRDGLSKGSILHYQFLKTDDEINKAMVPGPHHSTQQVVDLSRAYAANPRYPADKTFVELRRMCLLVAVARDDADAEASYELARFLRFMGTSTGAAPDVVEKKSVCFFFDAASRGHVLGLLACAHLLEDDVPYRLAAYEILRRGGGPDVVRLPEIQALLKKLVPPFGDGTHRFLAKEKSDYKVIERTGLTDRIKLQTSLPAKSPEELRQWKMARQEFQQMQQQKARQTGAGKSGKDNKSGHSGKGGKWDGDDKKGCLVM
ncbi:hypothetical protein HKX48_001155 [Thoreauomyces humboldtii]|nr:hypothetical protein HKX48_001155 [Thoreauomyces humboldtii]